MSRVYNFSAGPAVLPEEVLKEAAAEMLDYQGSGQSVMEMSHRGKDYDAIHQEAIATFKELCGLGDDWAVCFIQGGASMQFAMIPMNFLGKDQSADYANQGTWSNKALKQALPEMPVQLHTHYTSGLASMCLLKAVEAGADGIDTAISPLALGTSHAPTESMVAALQGTEYDTGLDIRQLAEIRAYFMTLRDKYIENGLLDHKMLATDAKALIYQVPGGMLSNLLSQLKQAGKEDKLDEVLEEVPRVREDSGYPPLVTPTSQIVGTQAVFNVITGERYSMCTREFKGMVAGEYGTTPMPIDPEFQKKICGDMEIIHGRPADRLEPELDKLRGEISEWIEQEEDVLSYAQFPKVALDFFEQRRNAKAGINGDLLDKENMIHPV